MLCAGNENSPRLSDVPALAKLGVRKYRMMESMASHTKGRENTTSTSAAASGIEREPQQQRPKRQKKKDDADDVQVDLDWSVAVPLKRKQSEQHYNEGMKIVAAGTRMLTQTKKYTRPPD